MRKKRYFASEFAVLTVQFYFDVPEIRFQCNTLGVGEKLEKGRELLLDEEKEGKYTTRPAEQKRVRCE